MSHEKLSDRETTRREARPRVDAERFALACEAAVAGGALYLLSYLLSYHNLNAVWGNYFIAMSEHPFRSGSPFEYRYLVPLLGWITGLRGHSYQTLSIAGGALFCVLVYAWSRRFYRSRSIALLLTLCLAFLSPIEFNHVAPNRSDIFCYLWLLSAMMWPRYAPAFVFLGLSSHEFFAIYIPFLYLYMFCFSYDATYRTRRLRMRALIGLAAALSAYAAVRWAIAEANEFSVRYSLSFYWNLISTDIAAEWQTQPILLGVLVSLKVFWVVLVLAALRLARTPPRNWAFLALLVMPAAGAFTLLLIAHDTSRFLGHAFVFVLLLPYALPRSRVWLPIVFALNTLIPSFYVGADWFVPCNRYANIFAPWMKTLFYGGDKYLPYWNRHD